VKVERAMGAITVVAGVGVAMLAWERWRPGRRFPTVRGWWARAFFLTALQAGVAWLATATWDHWLPQAALWRLGGNGIVFDAVAGYVVITFVYYWWHRARHEIPLLWRYLHQVHHSPCRIEVLTTFYKHPVEILLNGILSSAILYAFLGFDPASASLTVALTGVGEMIYHWNVRTPYWLGFLFQRPESHCVHHQRGRHTRNFSDLPMWDLLFGTFENPKAAPRECGFAGEAERRLLQLVLGRPPAKLANHDQPEKEST
jgi:sterol desaturase/sphingolipid hydroxylase (fatty acid hydroxylase superfamily)